MHVWGKVVFAVSAVGLILQAVMGSVEPDGQTHSAAPAAPELAMTARPLPFAQHHPSPDCATTASPFAMAGTQVSCRPGLSPVELPDTPQKRTTAEGIWTPPDPFTDLQDLVDSTTRGTTDTAEQYQFLRRLCQTSPALKLNSAAQCDSVLGIYGQFRANLEILARKGDPQSQKLLAIELIREFNDAQESYLADGLQGPSIPSEKLPPDTTKWIEALALLREAAPHDRKAHDLLQGLELGS